MGAERPLTSTERSARRRASLRAQGLRSRTFWLPDRDDPAFKAQAAAACLAVNQLMAGSDDMAFIDAVRYWPADE